METHFLNDYVEGNQGFRQGHWYNPFGDCIVFQTKNEAIVGDRVDHKLTLYRSAIDNAVIGYQIKDVRAILSRLGANTVAVASEINGESGSVRSISVVALLLAAYEVEPCTIRRRSGYAQAITRSDEEIPLDEILQGSTS